MASLSKKQLVYTIHICLCMPKTNHMWKNPSIKCLKWSYLCRGVRGGIITKFNPMHPCCRSLRLSIRKTSPVCFLCLIHYLWLPIGLWVICSTMLEGCILEPKQLSLENTRENLVSIKNDRTLESMELYYHFPNEFVRHLQCCKWMCEKNKVNILCESIHYHKDGGIPLWLR